MLPLGTAVWDHIEIDHGVAPGVSDRGLALDRGGRDEVTMTVVDVAPRPGRTMIGD
jgi:hypothetical protein